MSQITIRNMDPTVEKIIRDEARKQHSSLSDITNKLILKALGYETDAVKKRDLQCFAGAWTEKEAEEFEKTQKCFSDVDDEIWS